MWRDTYVTGLETLLGFAIGNFFGTLIGLRLWYSRFVSRVVEPFVIALGSIPIIALAPIIIIWFGTGLISKVAMSTLSVVDRGARHLLQGRDRGSIRTRST